MKSPSAFAVEPSTLWNRDFGLYWLGLTSAALGDAFVLIALPFLVLGLSGDPKAVALTLLIASLARFAGPIIGLLADRFPVRFALTLSGAVRAALFAILGALALTGTLPLLAIYIVAFLNGLVTTYVFAAGNVAVPALVPRAQLARANSLTQAALMGVPLLGLGVAGALVGVLGPAATFLFASPLLVLQGLLCAFVRFDRYRAGSVADSGPNPSIVSDLRAGLGSLFRAGPLALVLPISLLVNAALILLAALMPVLMERLGRGAEGYGMFEMLLSVGMLAGILAVSAIGARLAPQHGISVAQLVMAGGFGVMAVGGFAWLLGGAVVLGLGIGFTQVAAITLLQLAIPEGMRGKVMGAIVSTNAIGQSAGAALAAAVPGGLPAQTIFIVSAVAVLTCAAVWIVAAGGLPLRVRPVLHGSPLLQPHDQQERYSWENDAEQ